MRPFTILLAIGSSEIGGGQKVFSSCVSEFLSAGHEIIIILPPGPLVDVLLKYNVRIHIVDLYSISGFFYILKILKNNYIDIINVHLTKCAFFISFINLFCRLPICITLHNEIIHAGLKRSQILIYPFFYKILSLLCDGVIVVSEYTKQHLIKIGNIDPSKITVIRNGININNNFISNNINYLKNKKFLIGVIGRLSIEKGHIYLIHAIKSISDLNLECWIVGDGPLRNELEEKVAAIGMRGKIRFLGYQNDVHKLLNCFNVIVVPSLNESIPISIIEALAAKRPVIATSVGGIPELIVNNITGLLVPPRNSEELANKIVYLHQNYQKAIKMGENGYCEVNKNYSSSMMAENILSYYSVVISNKNYKNY